MATDATGAPTSLGIPKFDTSTDAPSGLGFNAAMDAINSIFGGYVAKSLVVSAGDLIYGTGSAAITRLPIGSNGQFLSVSGGIPAWVANPSAGAFSNPMTTAGDIIIGGAAGAAQRLAIGATGNALIVSGGAPAWGFPTAPAFTAGVYGGYNYAVSGGAQAALMMGVGAAGATITPTKTGKLAIVISGATSGGYVNCSINYQIVFGTGGAPGAGTGAVGTALGSQMAGINTNAAPFAITAGGAFTVGTTYWFDIQISASNSQGGQNPGVGGMSFTIVEVG